jgi:hypothetical protein
MEIIEIIDTFKEHKLVKANPKCNFCHGSLYRLFNSGDIVCVKCGDIIFRAKTDEKK